MGINLWSSVLSRNDKDKILAWTESNKVANRDKKPDSSIGETEICQVSI